MLEDIIKDLVNVAEVYFMAFNLVRIFLKMFVLLMINMQTVLSFSSYFQQVFNNYFVE